MNDLMPEENSSLCLFIIDKDGKRLTSKEPIEFFPATDGRSTNSNKVALEVEYTGYAENLVLENGDRFQVELGPPQNRVLVIGQCVVFEPSQLPVRISDVWGR